MGYEARTVAWNLGNIRSSWFRLTAIEEPPEGVPFHARENARRTRMASVILLVIGLCWLVLAPLGVTQGFGAYPLIFLLGLFVIGALLYLNHRGWVTAVGLFLIVLIDLGFLVMAIGTKTALPQRSSIFDILLIGDLVAVSTLEPGSVFFVALGNLMLVPMAVLGAGDFSMLAKQGSASIIGLIVQPLVTQALAAIVAYLWASSSLRYLRRVDQAESVAQIRAQDDISRRDLEEGLRQLLAMHAALANGNYTIRTPALRHPALWQMGASLNNLAARSARLAQEEFVLQRTREESHRLAAALNALRTGRTPIWPVPSGTPLDEVIEAAQGSMPLLMTSGPLPPDVPLSGPHGPTRSQANPPASYELPPWLRPAQQDDGSQPPGAQQFDSSGWWNNLGWPDLGGPSDPRRSGPGSR